MKFELKSFQEEKRRELQNKLNAAREEFSKSGELQAIVLSSPTGSGKTITIGALLESLFEGDDEYPAQPQARVLWISDSPELNIQSRDKLLKACDTPDYDDLEVISSDTFDEEFLRAGVVYFIDRGLATFAVDERKTYQEGLTELQARVNEMFPGIQKFSAATPEQQDEVLHSFDENAQSARRPFRARPSAQNFFETLRHHTIAGFLIDPDYGGNDSGVGWKVIGREREHVFQAPFGYYDKDYPGWQSATKEADKK